MDGEGAPQTMQEAQMLAVASAIERAVDDELDRIDNLDDDDITVIRRKRLAQVKEMQKRKDEWIQRGHGRYHPITDPKHFFDCVKQSERVVCHFRRNETERCHVVDGRMEKVAQRHFETRFCFVDVEKVPQLPQQFNVVMLPTIMLVEGGNTFHSIIGFEEFGNHDDFSEEDFEKVMITHGMVNDRDMFAADQSPDDY